MESLIRVIFNLSGRAGDWADTAWIRATESFFSVFLVIMVGVPVLAHFGLQGTIFFVMLAFFMVWLVATFRLRNIAVLSAASLGYGVPAEGDSGEYAKKALAMFGKAVFLVLIWGEIWMAVYFHFPSFAKEWWMIGSAVAVMLVIIPTVIYALATGHMLEGPWHKPVLYVAVPLLAFVMFSAIPNSVWTSVGINPLSFSVPETTERAQEIRAKSYQNLVGKKLQDMQSLKQKVDRGEVLSAEELVRLQALEQEAKVVPSLPGNPVVASIKDQVPGSLPDLSVFSGKQVVYGAAGLLILLWIVLGRKHAILFWAPVILIAGYLLYMSDAHRDTAQRGENGQMVQSTVPSAHVHFIAEHDWGKIGARRVSNDPMLQSMEPMFRIEKGQYNGKRPVPLLGMNGGSNITLIIEPDEADEFKDLIVGQQLQCPAETMDGSWVCTTTWRNRSGPDAKGMAQLKVERGVRTITLFTKNGDPVATFRIENLL